MYLNSAYQTACLIAIIYRMLRYFAIHIRMYVHTYFIYYIHAVYTYIRMYKLYVLHYE